MFWLTIVLFAAAGGFAGAAGKRALVAARVDVSAFYCALAAAACWAVTGWRWSAGAWPSWWLPVALVVTAFAVPLAYADLVSSRLPSVLTMPAYPAVMTAVGVAAAYDGPPIAVRAFVGAVVFGGAHLAVHLCAPRSLGAGDVRLAGSVGGVLGAVSWAALVFGALCAAVVTAALSLAGRRWRDGVPYGPGLLLGAWLIAEFPALGTGVAMVG
ncbi:leader peptidase (prepilin peptidase) / N-methyltransferase [Amycolatopsis xylanica]|uniref:Leader peptidase (Prepilin peptidase) / N-methyltransferase n=1 Tax=Amycolatopsis xylanica TaxID=589385 RepID=A0A1H3J899_9PSEU|nr:A24 family peptidase [Amycolatopsis xylanica]SDY35815.1 leader peptidase (prepilin peptidase) / N-methyltransferase [Amycolatopsis xylanica]